MRVSLLPQIRKTNNVGCPYSPRTKNSGIIMPKDTISFGMGFGVTDIYLTGFCHEQTEPLYAKNLTCNHYSWSGSDLSFEFGDVNLEGNLKSIYKNVEGVCPRSQSEGGLFKSNGTVRAKNVDVIDAEFNNLNAKNIVSKNDLIVRGNLTAETITTGNNLILNKAEVTGAITVESNMNVADTVSAKSIKVVLDSRLKNATVEGDISIGSRLLVDDNVRAQNIYAGENCVLNNATVIGEIKSNKITAKETVIANKIEGNDINLNQVDVHEIIVGGSKESDCANKLSVGEVTRLERVAFLKNSIVNDSVSPRTLIFREDLPSSKIKVLLGDFTTLVIHTVTGDSSVLDKLDFFEALIEAKSSIVKEGKKFSPETVKDFVHKGIIKLVKLAK